MDRNIPPQPGGVIVERVESGSRFMLVGTGYGLAESASLSAWASFLRVKENTCHMMVCVCDAKGELGWIQSKYLKVVSVGGVELSQVEGLNCFDDPEEKREVDEATNEPLPCVECGQVLETRVCPNCDP